MDISLIKPYPKNAKMHPKKQVQQIANSIKEFGFNQPIVIDGKNEIIVGHGRYEAAKILGLQDVPVIQVNLTEEQAKAYRLSDNKLNESDWDMNLVIEELKGLSEEMLDLTGFNKDLIIEPDEKDDIIPENVPPQSKSGDLYELGRHRVLCGDSTKREDVELLMDGKKADMVFTDPPYGISLDTDTEKVLGKNAKAKVYDRIIGDGIEYDASHIFAFFGDVPEILIWGADYFIDTIPDCGKTGNFLVWDKRVTGHEDKKNYASEFELCWSKQKRARRIYKHDWVRFFGMQKEDTKSRMHPNQKPTTLLAEMMPEGNLLVDLFLGSGSTLIASEKTGRICYGMELDPKYVDVIVERYCQYTGNRNIKKNGEPIIWQETAQIPS